MPRLIRRARSLGAREPRLSSALRRDLVSEIRPQLDIALRRAPGSRRQRSDRPAWPPLAVDKVRYVGEAIAACVAPMRGEAEDLTASITVDYEVLDAVVDPLRDMHGSPALVHEQWGDNLYLERTTEGGDIEGAARAAEVTVTRRYRTEPAVGRATRRPCRARLSRPSARRNRDLCLDPDAAYGASRDCREPGH